MTKPTPSPRLTFKTRNGRCIVYCDGLIFFMFNQIDFKGLYAYKDDVGLYGLDLYLKDTTMEIYFKTRELWVQVMKVLGENL